MFSANTISTMAKTRKEIVDEVARHPAINLPYKQLRAWIDHQRSCVGEVPLRRVKQKIWLVRHDDGLRWLAVPEAKERCQGGTCYVQVACDTGTADFKCVPIWVEDEEFFGFLRESGLPIRVEAANHKRNRQTIKRHPVAFVH